VQIKAELIKILFRVNTLGGLLDIVLHGGLDPPTDGEKEVAPNGPQRVKW